MTIVAIQRLCEHACAGDELCLQPAYGNIESACAEAVNVQLVKRYVAFLYRPISSRVGIKPQVGVAPVRRAGRSDTSTYQEVFEYVVCATNSKPASRT